MKPPAERIENTLAEKREASFLQFAIDAPFCCRPVCKIRGENPSSLHL
jgi:hypothetical protein